jgi:hypothetical protein
MSEPSPARHHFNTGDKQLVRFRVEAAAVLTAIVVLAHAALIDHAIAATEYAVDGLAVATQLNFGSASYREYKCSPSDQFEGLTWCQKIRAEKGRRGSQTTAYSLLHSKDGKISYINRSQEPASFNPSESELNIERYSRQLGASARILKAPHRSSLPHGVIAVWGKITLEPLDQGSIKLLADGKNPRKGFLIDYLRDFTRSAKEGLPIYRIVGGPGFIWAASFDQKGRGTARLAAVDLSGFAPPPDSAPVEEIAAPTQQEQLPPPAPVVATAAPTQQEELRPAGPVVATAAPTQQEQLPPAGPVVATAAPTQQEQLPPAAAVVATAAPAQQEPLPPAAAVVATAGPAQQEELSSELNRTIEKLQADLAISTTRVAELETAKSVVERALEKAEQAKLDAENAKQQLEQERVAENASSNALIAQSRADKAAAGAKISRWEIVLYGSVGGVLFFLITSAIGFVIKRGIASVSTEPVEKTQSTPTGVPAQSQDCPTPRQPSAGSAGITISEAAFERDLEEEVATINAAKAAQGSGPSAVATA